MSGEGKVDPRFNIVGMCQAFGWTYEQYLQRPLWFDDIYAVKCKADAKAHEFKNKPA